MGRRKLAESTNVEKFHIPEEEAEAFRARCKRLGRTRSEVLRSLVAKWLRQTDNILRLRAAQERKGKAS